jgi:hypothetical protein
MTLQCPSCNRPNSVGRDSCMYCGQPVPDDADATPDTDTSVPPDLDKLFRAAMARGDVGALRAALEDHKVAAQAPLADDSLPTIPASVLAPLAPTEDIDSLLDRLADGAQAARGDWAEGHVEAVRKWLPVAERMIQELGDQLPSAAEAPAVPVDVPRPVVTAAPVILLPKVRQEAALIVEGLADPDRAAALAECLNIDAATARLFAVSRHPRVVLRSADLERLGIRATRIRESMGVRAAAFQRADLLAPGPALAVVRVTSADPLTIDVVRVDIWDTEENTLPTRGEKQTLVLAPAAVVSGEVVVQHFRPARSVGRLKHLRESRVRETGERRIATVDIHDPDGIYRISEGNTILEGFDGAEASSFRRSLRALLDTVAGEGSGVHQTPSRVCQPGLGSSSASEGSGVKSRDTGWATWEEHSRACRLLYLPDSE